MLSSADLDLGGLSTDTDRCLNLSALCHPCRFRFVDCDQLLHHQTLRIVETDDLSSVAYSAISYVWKGNPVDGLTAATVNAFSVTGATEGDPINIDVLIHACTVSTTILGANHVWLDRVCIMQTSKEDKPWQIRMIHAIYQNSKGCIVLPGGISRLVRLDEETAWIHRGWTLQEALVPPKVVVLFAWKAGSGQFSRADYLGAKIVQVMSRKSAIASIRDLLDACTTGYLLFSSVSGQISGVPVQVRIFGSATPNVRALGVLTSEELTSDQDIRDHTIWKASFLRTPSRPVDMVFSIMGLFGVDLDPQAYDADDRISATIALARELVNNGRSAGWLGMAFRLPPSLFLSTLPVLPKTSIEGCAMVDLADGLYDVAQMVDCEYPIGTD